jgi:hypothetical protein
MKSISPWASPFLALAIGALLSCPGPAHSQQTASVTVNAASGLGAVPATALGVNTAVWDGLLLDTSVPTLLKRAGVTTLRFPGGSTADVYHWQHNAATAGSGQYINPQDTFDAFMRVAQRSGAGPIITVNYGSNAAGTAGGDPAEAAAWVKYANVTHKYGVKYWEIGNEQYGNGEYGGQWETDLHADHSPTAYGANALAYITAMKQVDPTIQVGVVLIPPGNWPDGQYPDWNSNVLAACGSKIDFVAVHWYAQGPGGESDFGLLSASPQVGWMASSVRSLINQYCGANAPNVQIMLTEANSVTYNPGKQTVGPINGLFLADCYMTALENGIANVDWWNLHNGMNTGGNNSPGLFGNSLYGDYGLLSSGNTSADVSEPAAETPFPDYCGLQMLQKLVHPGDQMVATSSSQSLVTAYAVRHTDGTLRLLLINKDPSNSYNVSLALSGYTPHSTYQLSTFGENSAAITTSTSSGAGASFNQTLAPYSLTLLQLHPIATEPPAFATSATVSPLQVLPGTAVTVNASVTDFGGPLANAVVDVEVDDANGNRVAQSFYTGQNFAANQTIQYAIPLTTLSSPDVYTVKFGIFGPNWSPLIVWNNGAAQFTAGAPDPARYNFETGTQGWQDSGGMITGVGTSLAQAFAGAYSLGVNFNGVAGDSQSVYLPQPSTPPGATATFHVWIPAGSALTALQPFALQGPSGSWGWTGNYVDVSTLQTNAWNTVQVTIPTNAAPLYQLGVQFITNGAWSGTCYIDSVTW